MAVDDDQRQRVFFDVHTDLPREGPGNRDSTHRALDLASLAARIPFRRVLDVACGPGMQTRHLAERLPEAHILAMDLHGAYLNALLDGMAPQDPAARVTVMRADMTRLPVAPQSMDLVWCEGAAYIMGVDAALAAWREVLVPGGVCAFTEAVWLRGDAPADVRRCWAEYPAMGDVAACRALLTAAGFALAGDFVLPASAWWDDYYRPMAERITRLRARYSGDAGATAVLDECQQEIDMFQRHGDCYGYVFFVARKT